MDREQTSNETSISARKRGNSLLTSVKEHDLVFRRSFKVQQLIIDDLLQEYVR